MSGLARRHGWYLLFLVTCVSLAFFAQCVAAAVLSPPRHTMVGLCKHSCSPAYPQPSALATLPTLVLLLPLLLPRLQAALEKHHHLLPRMARGHSLTRAPPYRTPAVVLLS